MRTLLILLLTALAGCGGAPVLNGITAEEEAWLLGGASLQSVAHAPVPEGTVLTITAEMQRFAEQAVSGHQSAPERIRALLQALVSPALLGITYDASATLTPTETFRSGRANCLSFTMLYVLLARHVGLPARFNEVDVPPVWEMQSPQTLILYKHVNALLDPRHGGRRVIDLDIDNYDTSYPQREISDDLAEAQYFNNRAMEHMFEGRLPEAQRYLAKAIRTAPRVSYFWGNLASLYRRAGDTRAAELAFRKALDIRPVDPVAISNAARLYTELGQDHVAAQLEEQAASHRRRNPYYRYQQGLSAFVEGDYDIAKDHVLAAIAAHGREHRFHFLLGAVYSRVGEPARAQDSFARAIELAGTDQQASLYRHKMDLLRSAHL